MVKFFLQLLHWLCVLHRLYALSRLDLQPQILYSSTLHTLHRIVRCIPGLSKVRNDSQRTQLHLMKQRVQSNLKALIIPQTNQNLETKMSRFESEKEKQQGLELSLHNKRKKKKVEIRALITHVRMAGGENEHHTRSQIETLIDYK